MTSYKRRQIVHECGEPLCHKIIPVSQRYCQQHKAMYEEEWQAKKDEYRRSKLGQAIKAQQAKIYDKTKRDQTAVEFYHSHQWQAVRDYVYARDGATCQSCGNVVTDRKIIDHIIPRRLCTKEQALSTSNLWTLCYRCHYRKTKIEQAIAAQPNGDNKLKHLDRRWWTKVLQEKKEDNNG